MLGRTPSAEPRKAYGHAVYGLAERRRTRRRRGLVAFLILLLLLLASAVWGLGQNAVRISHIEVIGADASLSAYATDAMKGSYFGIIPRDSIFFFPEERIRADILASHNNIAAVSILRNGFTGISIKVDYRVPIARWCGLAPTPDADEYCYIFDANGYIFEAAASTTQTVNSFAVYAPLLGETEEPLRTTIANSEALPHVFDLARQLGALGSPAARVVIRADEVDDILASGTRITYVLGHEQEAYTALVSAQPDMNLSDGSIDYVDLRFGGKVYLKKK